MRSFVNHLKGTWDWIKSRVGAPRLDSRLAVPVAILVVSLFLLSAPPLLAEIGDIWSVGAPGTELRFTSSRNLVVPGTITGTGHNLPAADDTYDLGSASAQWRDLFIDGTANIDLGSIDAFSAALLPNADNTLDVGSAAASWNDCWFDGTATIANATVTAFTSALLPNADNTLDAGSVAASWNDCWFDGTATLATAAITNCSITALTAALLPNADNTLDVGSLAASFQDCWFDGTATLATAAITNCSITALTAALLPNADNTLDLGSAGASWNDAWIDGTSTLATVTASGATSLNGAATIGDAPADTVTIRGTATVADPDGGDAASFQKLTSRLNVRQTAGVGLINTGYDLIEDGEAVADWTAVDADCAVIDNDTNYRYGASSLKLNFFSTAAAADGATQAKVNEDWSGIENVGFWIYSDATFAAGDFVFRITDGTQGNTDTNIGAVATANTWTFVTVDISGVADVNKDDVDGVGVLLTAQGEGALAAISISFDSVIRWDNSGDLALTGTVLDGGVVGIFKIPTAAATDNTLTMLAEGTDYWVRPGSSAMLIFITDQSAAQVLATYATQ